MRYFLKMSDDHHWLLHRVVDHGLDQFQQGGGHKYLSPTLMRSSNNSENKGIIALLLIRDFWCKIITY